MVQKPIGIEELETKVLPKIKTYVDSKDGGTIDVVPSDDKFTVSDPDGVNSATLQVGGAGVLMDISGSQVANLASKTYVDNIAGNLTDLTTTAKTNVVSAINELKSSVDALGEPFRVKQWGANNLNVTIVPCTSDVANTSLAKMTYTITGQEATDYQIVGMVAYEVFDAASGGNRINCWPVCQFTGQNQTELSVRWMCGGTTDKVAKRINAWVLLKHR